MQLWTRSLYVHQESSLAFSVLVQISVHPKGLTPFEAAKARQLRHDQKLLWAAGLLAGGLWNMQ